MMQFQNCLFLNLNIYYAIKKLIINFSTNFTIKFNVELTI